MKYKYNSKRRKKVIHIVGDDNKTLCNVEEELRIKFDTTSDEIPEGKKLCVSCLKSLNNQPIKKILKRHNELNTGSHRDRKSRRYCLDYFKLNEYATNIGIAYCISQELDVLMPETDKEIRRFITWFADKKIGLPVRTPKKWVSAKEFYASKKWKELRYIALANSEGKCTLCGAKANDGVSLHVDHIKPRSRYPDLAYDLSNLQILCEWCNMGKSNYDEIDHRS